MKTVGISYLRTHWSALVHSVADGETILITRHGKPMARIVPAETNVHADLKKLAEEMLEARNRRSLGGLKIVDLIHEGRRY